MEEYTPLSALLVDLEADELRAQLPSLADSLFENPWLAQMLDMLVNDVYAFAAAHDEAGRTLLRGEGLALRLGAWRKVARDALAITEAT